MLIVVCFVLRKMAQCSVWYALCSVERRNADCRVLCVQGQKREAAVTKMLIVLCFVFKRMSACQKQSALMIIIIIIIYI